MMVAIGGAIASEALGRGQAAVAVCAAWAAWARCGGWYVPEEGRGAEADAEVGTGMDLPAESVLAWTKTAAVGLLAESDAPVAKSDGGGGAEEGRAEPADEVMVPARAARRASACKKSMGKSHHECCGGALGKKPGEAMVPATRLPGGQGPAWGAWKTSRMGAWGA